MKTWLLFLVLLCFGLSTEARQIVSMFNACDQCRSWSAKSTAILIQTLDAHEVGYEFVAVSNQVILTSVGQHPVCYEPFAIFFEDQTSCRQYLSRIKFKCELTVTAITGY